MQNGEIIRMDSVDDYNRFFGLDTEHPLVSVVDLSMATKWAERARSRNISRPKVCISHFS